MKVLIRLLPPSEVRTEILARRQAGVCQWELDLSTDDCNLLHSNLGWLVQQGDAKSIGMGTIVSNFETVIDILWRHQVNHLTVKLIEEMIAGVRREALAQN